MDATCTIQDSIHVFSLVHKYVSRILGTYQIRVHLFYNKKITFTCKKMISKHVKRMISSLGKAKKEKVIFI